MPAKLTLDHLRTVAASRGGACLARRYVNCSTKVLWKCAEGHRWRATAASVNHGSWCRKCGLNRGAAKQKLTIEKMDRIAVKRGGKCVSRIYSDAHTKLEWECSKGHRWHARPNNVLNRGSWCPICARKQKGTIEEMRQLAISRGGKCLSKKYTNRKTQLIWQCPKGHRWKAAPGNVKGQGQWCPKCAGVQRHTLEDMQRVAKERGGKCLSRSYERDQAYLWWQCAEGHKWKAFSADVMDGSWCPQCSDSLGERICRQFFEQLFRKLFPSVRPEWLVSSRGHRMELDGYCESLGLAFEHQGEQHTRPLNKYFHRDAESFARRIADDRLKRKLCRKHGVVLIAVPQIPDVLALDEVKPFIAEHCVRQHVSLPRGFHKRKVSLVKAYSVPVARIRLDELRKIAAARGGRYVPEHYYGSARKVPWMCSMGHEWEATPSSVKHGRWCPECAGTRKGTLKEMQLIAAQHGGKCLSTSYRNRREKMLWQCVKGHRWEAASVSIKSQGSWCPICAGKAKLGLEEMQRIASSRGGKCLSRHYRNVSTKLWWQCAKGHKWRARPLDIKHSRTWCPTCAWFRRFSK
jgi:hypothetical protein